MKKSYVVKPENRFYMIRLVEDRLRYLESLKWTTKNDEARVAEMHRLNVLWSDLVVEEDAKKRK